MTIRRPRRLPPEINLTPLIDILFIVLIFLVLTATFADTTTFQVNLPPATTGEPSARQIPGRVVVSVAADGTIQIAGDIVTADELERRLQSRPDRDRLTLVLSADTRASHGDVVAVMDRIRRAGILRISIETRMVDSRL